jgi:hypothetical protein
MRSAMKYSILDLVGATGTGKTTLARRLVRDHDFVDFHVGRPLKDMLRVLGLSEEDVNGSSEQRARPQMLLGGKSARYALSTLGTDWGRNMITPQLWPNAVKLRVHNHLNGANPAPVVIDDLRFPDDWAIVKQFHGLILTIRRPEKERPRTVFDKAYYRYGMNRLLRGRGILRWSPIHETEFHWPDAPSVAEVWNTGAVDDLVATALTHWR